MHTRRSCCSGPWQHVSSSTTTSLLRWRRCSGPAIRWPGSATAHCFGWDVDAKAPRRPEVSTCAATPFPSFCWFESQDCQPVRGPSFFLVGWVSAPITGERQGRCMWSVRHRVHCHKSLGTCKHCCGTRLPRCASAEKQKQQRGCGTRVAFRRRANETRLPLVFMTYRVASSSLCMWATHGTCEGSQSSVPSRENGAKTQKHASAWVLRFLCARAAQLHSGPRQHVSSTPKQHDSNARAALLRPLAGQLRIAYLFGGK